MKNKLRLFRAYTPLALQVVGLEIKVESLEARLKDLDKIEKLVFDAYAQTHPEAQETILAMDRVVDMGELDFLFANPTSATRSGFRQF